MTAVRADAYATLLDVGGALSRNIDLLVRALGKARDALADLHQGLDSTLTLVAHLLKNRITIRRDYGDLPAVDYYPSQLNQVFLNILVNAAQAITGEGEIAIRTRLAADGAAVEIEIADTGCGIPPEQLGKIFDPGFTTKESGGHRPRFGDLLPYHQRSRRQD